MLGARAQLDEGLLFERAGSIQRALIAYQTAAAAADTPDLVAEALRRQSVAHRLRCDWPSALDAARRSAEIAKIADLPLHYAEALNVEATIHQRRGDFDEAVSLLEQVLDFTDDDRIRGIALQNLGAIDALRGRHAEAEGRFRESYESFARVGDARGVAFALTNCSALANLRRDHEAALAAAERAMVAARRLQDYEILAHASLNCAEALIAMGRFARAEELVSAALGYFTVEENACGRIGCLRLLGDLNRRIGNLEQAEIFYRYGLELAGRIGAKVEADQITARIAALPPEAADPVTG